MSKTKRPEYEALAALAPNVSRETFDGLKRYQALLEKWQGSINLVGKATLPDLWDRHFLDSAQILASLPSGIKTLYDLGSGAGFPGLVLSVLRPDLHVTLIESDLKKASFLRAAARETQVDATILAERIEGVAGTLPFPDCVTARALAPVAALFAFCRPWLSKNPSMICVFPKGERWEEELEDARKNFAFECFPQKSVTDERSRLLILSKISAL